jgi:hypothetical protein
VGSSIRAVAALIVDDEQAAVQTSGAIAGNGPLIMDEFPVDSGLAD